MKILLLALSGCLLFGIAVIASPLINTNQRLLGLKQCTFGPTFWCSNITNAKSCNAVKHCIQTVWEKQTVPEDNDSICQICLDMVKQARDQLESNETQDDLRAVFEGSCKLIPVKIVRKECIKLADDFIPELIEALASQMNPNVVCSVAGLCNNAAIDKLLTDDNNNNNNNNLETENISTSEEETKDNTEFTCEQCNNIGSIITKKFHDTDRDDLLEKMLYICGTLSSFSDACSNVVLVHFNEIYNHLETNLKSNVICHMSGVCAHKYHSHDDDTSKDIIEIRPMSNVGFVSVNDDIPCELCEQLVKHLRDVLIANTTEDEFRLVLEGVCKQTGKFKTECLSIVNQYYDVIYKSLVNNLDANGACYMIGICPKGLTNSEYNDNAPIMPLVPLTTAQEIYITISKNPPKKLLGEDEPILTSQEILNAQLPIDILVGAPNSKELVENGQLCTICEYILHFLQEELASPSTEEEIKNAVFHTCEKLPKTIGEPCHSFVSMYGDAIIALLIQEMEPRNICPILKLCPKNVKDTEVFAPKPIDVTINTQNSGTDKCPICLFAIAQLEEEIKSNRTKESIKHALAKLCIHLPNKMQSECNDFVATYTSELVEMLLTDFTATEICVYLKCCSDSKPDLSTLNIRFDDNNNNDVLTNEIPDNTINGQHISSVNSEYLATPNCLLCVEIVKEVEKKIIHKKSREEIKYALSHACDRLHKLKNKCQMLIDNHGDQIADFIIQELAPKEICKEIGFCIQYELNDLSYGGIETSVLAVPADESLATDTTHTINDAPECMLCKMVMTQLEKELKNKKTQEEIENTIKNICKVMPKRITPKCNKFVDTYGDTIINLITTMSPTEMCIYFQLCTSPNNLDEKDLDIDEAIQTSIVAIPVDKSLSIMADKPLCGICQMIMVQIEKEMADEKTQEEIETSIKTGCKLLPKSLSSKCYKFVDEYGAIVIALFATMPPREICTYIECCTTGKVVKTKDEILECSVCHGSVNSIEKMLENYPKETEINLLEIGDDACNKLPGEFYQRCTNLIEVYGYSIINIVRSGDSKHVCSKIGMCYIDEEASFVQMDVTEAPKKMKLVGDNKCLWGPSYWCDSKDAAAECGAHKFCSEKHWENGIPPEK